MTSNGICLGCGISFLRDRGQQKYCTKECQKIYYAKNHREEARQRVQKWRFDNPDKYAAVLARHKQPPKFANCKHCNKVFRKNTAGIFCSISCRGAHRRKTKPEWYQAAHQRYKKQSNEHSLNRYYRARQNAPWQIMVEVAAVRARKKKIPYDLTLEWAKKRWDGKCEITGIPFILGEGIRGLFSPSLDQIKPSAGYTQDNCRFVLWAINSMKGAGTDADILKIAKAIVDSKNLICDRTDLSSVPRAHIENNSVPFFHTDLNSSG